MATGKRRSGSRGKSHTLNGGVIVSPMMTYAVEYNKYLDFSMAERSPVRVLISNGIWQVEPSERPIGWEEMGGREKDE